MSDRLGPGRLVSPRELAEAIALVETPDLSWKHIHCVATVMAEHGSPGIFEWQRPIVINPDSPAHLSIDRGVWQINSFWWSHVTDRQAYDLHQSTVLVMQWLNRMAMAGERGATSWDWRPLLDWQWNAFGSAFYARSLSLARLVVNIVRDQHKLEQL